MKKLIFVFCLIFATGSVFAQYEGYNLENALKELNVNIENHPEYLPGAGQMENHEIRTKYMGSSWAITYYIQRIATALTGLAAAVAVLFIIQNSFNILTSAGGSEIITKSKKGLMWSIIGLVLIMGAYIVVKTIVSLPYSAEVLIP